MKGGWLRVSKKRRCPICDHDHWCLVADVQLGKPIVVPQVLIHTYVIARFLTHFEGYNWLASR